MEIQPLQPVSEQGFEYVSLDAWVSHCIANPNSAQYLSIKVLSNIRYFYFSLPWRNISFRQSLLRIFSDEQEILGTKLHPGVKSGLQRSHWQNFTRARMSPDSLLPPPPRQSPSARTPSHQASAIRGSSPTTSVRAFFCAAGSQGQWH